MLFLLFNPFDSSEDSVFTGVAHETFSEDNHSDSEHSSTGTHEEEDDEEEDEAESEEVDMDDGVRSSKLFSFKCW